MILTDTMNAHRRWFTTRSVEPTKWLIPVSRAYEFIDLPASQIGADLVRRIRAEGPFRALPLWRGIRIEWTDGGVLRLV